MTKCCLKLRCRSTGRNCRYRVSSEAWLTRAVGQTAIHALWFLSRQASSPYGLSSLTQRHEDTKNGIETFVSSCLCVSLRLVAAMPHWYSSRNNFPIFMRLNKESRKTGRSANRHSCFRAFLIICVIRSLEVEFRDVISDTFLGGARSARQTLRRGGEDLSRCSLAVVERFFEQSQAAQG